MPKHITVEYDGHIYNTFRDAWRANALDEVPEITARRRWELGWSLDDAFHTPPVPASERRMYKKVRE